jgi:hypothetical protein
MRITPFKCEMNQDKQETYLKNVVKRYAIDDYQLLFLNCLNTSGDCKNTDFQFFGNRSILIIPKIMGTTTRVKKN